jgi:NTE family protein
MNLGRAAGANGELRLATELGHDLLPRQIVTLAFLGKHLPGSLFSEQLARALCAETAAPVVLVRLEPADGGRSEAEVRPELFLNGEFHLPPALDKTDAGFHSLVLGVGNNPPTPPGLASLVNQLSRHFRYVLIQVQADERPAPWIAELLCRSNLGYVFLKRASEEVYRFGLLMQEARTRGHNGCAHIKPIACLAEGERTENLELLLQRVSASVHFSVHGCPSQDAVRTQHIAVTAQFRADLRRLAREICGRLVGLALSSGAAKGFAHVGVLQVLEENGLEVDVVAGASMGAYVGALWAYGCDGRELERLSRELEARWALWTLVDPAFPPRRGFLRGFAVKRRLMRTIARARFADLVRPLRIVAANLSTLERVVFSSGEVATAVHASSAVPGICVPVANEGETYSDGGIVDPLPVDVLREMGVDRIIAVNVIPTPDRIRCAIQAELERKRRSQTSARRLLRKLFPLNRQINYFARGNLLEILMRSLHGAQIRMAEASCEMADVVLRPEIYDDSWLDYRNPGKFIALGRQEAERHLEEIKALMNRTETSYEPRPAQETLATVA